VLACRESYARSSHGSKVGEGGGREEADAGSAHVAMHAGRRPAATRRHRPDPSCSCTTLRWLPRHRKRERPDSNGGLRGVEQRQAGSGAAPASPLFVRPLCLHSPPPMDQEKSRELEIRKGCFHFAPSLFGYCILVPITYIPLRFNL
jgi:hypothetical protein